MDIISRAEALQAGKKHYFTGKPCPHGHVAPRLVSTRGCSGCGARWRKKNPEKERASREEWQRRNPEKVSAKYRRYREKHRDARNADSREWRLKNPDYKRPTRDSHIEFYRKNREVCLKRSRNFRKKNLERYAAYKRNRDAKIRNSPGSHTAADVRYIRKLQRNKCAYCRTRLIKGKTHIDHIIPIARGGTNDRTNLQVLCEPCNVRKSARDPLVYARSLGRLL